MDYYERELTADEFGEWLTENLKAVDRWLHREHGGATLYKVLETMTASEIVSAVEKAKQPTFKHIDTCRIIEDDGDTKKCVYEYDMVDECKKKIGVDKYMENILEHYMDTHKGTVFATKSKFFAVLSQRVVAMSGIDN